MKTFSEKLKQLRKEKNLTLKETSAQLGLTTNAFSNYEQGIREPSLDILKKICIFFQVSADYLLDIELIRLFSKVLQKYFSEPLPPN